MKNKKTLSISVIILLVLFIQNAGAKSRQNEEDGRTLTTQFNIPTLPTSDYKISFP
ncbi:MAG: hypothetical protein P8Y68_13245 [Anaerolineales bacterium]|jgi:hypothetical protein